MLKNRLTQAGSGFSLFINATVHTLQKLARDVRHGNFPLQMARKRLDRLHSEMHTGVRMRRTLARRTLDALPDFSIGASGISFKQTVVVVDECRVSEFCHHQDTSKPEVFFTPLTCTPSGFARTKSCRRPSFGLSPRL